MTAAFPGHPPFGGAHGEDVVRTVGQGVTPAELRTPPSAPRLPVATVALAPPGPSSAE